MRRFGFILSQTLEDLGRQRLRTILTILGITWGTTAVVTLLAFGVGFERQMTVNAQGMGDGIVIVWGNHTTLPFQGFNEGRRIRLIEADADLLAREIPEVGIATPEYGRWGRHVSVGDRRTEVYLTGVRAEYGNLRNVLTEPGGRFLNKKDIEGQRRVIVLGDEVSRLLFGDEDPVGREVMLGRSPFVVIGVMQKKGQNSSYSARDQDRAFIPITTYRTMEGARYLNNLLLQPVDPELSGAAVEGVRQVLGRRYTFNPEDRSALNIWDTNEMMKMFKYIFIGFNAFLGLVGSFTLVVGGVGVANIMFVVVQERTREFGIRRALGALKRDILEQVLLEALFIVAVGAALGFALSHGLAYLGGMLPIEEFVGVPTISSLVTGITVGLLTIVALTAGLLPARKAARLDPADAIRHGG
jgi:putative ABC transport system permease protein